MVFHSGCFDSHFAAPCLVSCPYDNYRMMYGSITFGFFTWPVAIGCQESSPQAFLGALLGLKHGVEGILTSL